jgi:hypothetical protein
MSDIALYYPYLHFQDEGWLKTAVLFWPKIGRIVPGDFRPRDTPTVHALVDHGLVFNVPPRPWTFEVGQDFMELLASDSIDLERRYRLSSELVARGRVDLGRGDRPSGEAPYVELDDTGLRALGWLNIDRVSGRLRDELRDRGLAVLGDGPTGIWVGVHPKLSTVYKCALAERIASANGMQTITEETSDHIALSGWSLDTLAEVLLDDIGPEVTTRPDDIAEVFALAALHTVVPAGLDRIPVKQILRVRSELQQEFVGFRDFVAGLHGQFTEISSTEAPDIRARKLEIPVKGIVEPRLQALERAVRQAKLEPIPAVISMKSLAPPAMAEVVAHQVGLPPGVSAAGTVAVTLLASARNARQKAHELQTQSPVGYLLGLKRGLSPGTVVRAATAMFHRANRRK